ncbi:glycerol-3-phosphate dehydrogenase [Pelagibacteraceae bacterium]|nr:glycerol-3-phosphate dehydrogenase [Pelagibacteraceae bacterium]
MSNIVIIGAGTMGAAFSISCLDNKHEVTILGTVLEDQFIEDIKNNNNFHEGLQKKIPKNVSLEKFKKIEKVLNLKIDLIVIAVASKGIEWVAKELSIKYKGIKIPPLLMLTKGLSIYNNKYELLVDKMLRILEDKNIKDVNISAIGGPCLAKGLANKVHTSVILANKDINLAKNTARLINNSYYHVSVSNDLIGVEVCAAIKNIFSMAVGAAEGLCSKIIDNELKKENYLNSASSLINQSIHEMEIFVEYLKGKKETVQGLAGLGDLYVSTVGGRNSKMGFYIGSGLKFSEVKKNKMKNITVEGAELVFEIGSKIKKDFTVKQLPLMFSMIEAIINDEKINFNWELLNK